MHVRRLLLGVTLLLSTAVAWAQPISRDPVKGRWLATTRCARCHSIAPEAPRVFTSGVPNFTTIAFSDKGNERFLYDFLQRPHASMPNPGLTRDEVGDLTAYILSLRQYR